MIFSNAIVFLGLSALRAAYLVEGHGQHHHRHLGGSAAQKKCGTRAASTEDRAKAEEVSRQWSAARKADFTDVEIEVFIHVITDTSGNGALTMDNLNDSIDHLNNEYADTGFSFTLKGATCTADNDWYDSRDDREMQEALRVGDEKTLNVYYRSIEGNLGYATIPVWYNDDPTADGVVMRSDQYTGSGDAQYGEGDTLVHEM